MPSSVAAGEWSLRGNWVSGAVSSLRRALGGGLGGHAGVSSRGTFFGSLLDVSAAGNTSKNLTCGNGVCPSISTHSARTHRAYSVALQACNKEILNYNRQEIQLQIYDSIIDMI